MSDESGEEILAAVKFTADDGQLVSTIETSRNKINQVAPSAKGAQLSLAEMGKVGKASAASAGDAFKSTSAEIDKATGKHKSWQKQLKSEAGRRSELGETLEILRGAGAVAGLAIVGEIVKDTTAKLANVRNAYRSGDSAATAVEIGKSLPIIGSFVEAGQSIRELIFEEQRLIDVLKSQAEWGSKFADSTIATERSLAIHHRATQRQSDEMDEQQIVARQVRPKDIERARQDVEYNKRERDRAQEYQDGLRALKDKQKTDIEAAQEKFKWEPTGSRTPEEAQNEIAQATNTIKNQFNRDAEQLRKDGDIASAAIQKWNTAEKSRIEGIQKEAYELQNRTSLIGLTPMEAARKAYENAGYGLDAINGLMKLKGDEIVATTHQSLLMPYEKYLQELKNISEQEAAGLSGTDSQRARMRAVMQYGGGGQSVEAAWQSNMAIYMGRRATGDPLGLNANGSHKGPADDNTTATMDNTKAVKDLTSALASGITGTFA